MAGYAPTQPTTWFWT